MKSKRFKIAGIIFLVIFIFVILVRFLNTPYEDRVKDYLLINNLPKSLINLECDTGGFTSDLIEFCYFEISPSDFDVLTTGWNFEKREDIEKAIYLCPSIGKRFEISTWLETHPVWYKNGGTITIIANKDKTKICVEKYVE